MQGVNLSHVRRRNMTTGGSMPAFKRPSLSNDLLWPHARRSFPGFDSFMERYPPGVGSNYVRDDEGRHDQVIRLYESGLRQRSIHSVCEVS